jgi:hypothetical protein
MPSTVIRRAWPVTARNAVANKIGLRPVGPGGSEIEADFLAIAAVKVAPRPRFPAQRSAAGRRRYTIDVKRV